MRGPFPSDTGGHDMTRPALVDYLSTMSRHPDSAWWVNPAEYRRRRAKADGR